MNFKNKVWRTAHGHHLMAQGMMETSQPVPLNNHQPRAGTKNKSQGCQCEMCVGYGNKEITKRKLAKKEVKDALDKVE
jgi:hypothetical protein